MNSVADKEKYMFDEDPDIVKHWEITVPAGASREFIYTNHAASHFSAESAGPNSRSYHGLYSSMHEYLDSWEFIINNKALEPGRISKARAFPHTIYRFYEDRDVCEEIVLPDAEDSKKQKGVAVRFSGSIAGENVLVPWMDMRFIWETPKPDYVIFWEENNNILLISRADKPFPKGQPRWLAVTANVPLRYVQEERFRNADYPKDAARRAMGRTYPFTPGRFVFTCDKKKPLIFGFGLGVNETEAVGAARDLVANAFTKYKQEKLARIEDLVMQAKLPEGNTEKNKALRWALVSMDNLIMNQRGRGIYAGFHWFPNYWGRDSFICLPGACLATGRFDTSRDVLLSFMQYQQTDKSSPRLGRFPNIVNPDNLQYAGVDGTWWLVRAAWKHIVASGDTAVLYEGFPHISLAIEGALSSGAVDDLGFLTHGDGETWMDAGGEANPFSPRGDRAVEVQALFHHGLLAGAAWARMITAALPEDGVYEHEKNRYSGSELISLAERWEEQAELTRTNFRQLFIYKDQSYLHDHLNANGSQDRQIRPNAILALWVSNDIRDLAAGQAGDLEIVRPRAEELIGSEASARIVETALETVILAHGITSLDPKDPQFLPYHLNLDRYYYDAAYHNGDVWEWLTGPAVSCLLASGKKDEAAALIELLTDEILNRACVGSLREIRDGEYTKGKEEFGGATSQAWSLAEYLRILLTESK